MFRFYYTFDLNSEIEKELLRASHLAQILIDEFDLYVISKALFEATAKGVSLEIVIISASNNKSMKLVNLCKRLVDQGVIIFWKVDKTLFSKEDYFAIFDKQYLVCRREQADFENPEKLLRIKNDYFNGLSITSKKLNLLAGEIDIQFSVDQSIVYSNSEVILNWDVKNAHEISIEPDVGNVENKGASAVKIKQDIKFILKAKNKDNSVRKSLFIRVIKEKEIDFTVEVYDPILKEFMEIQSSSFDKGLYAAFYSQKIKILWNIPMIGKLIESKIGNLSLTGQYEFDLTKNEFFFFTFKSLNKTQTKKINFKCFDDDIIFNNQNQKELQNTQLINKKNDDNLFQKVWLYLLAILEKILKKNSK